MNSTGYYIDNNVTEIILIFIQYLHPPMNGEVFALSTSFFSPGIYHRVVRNGTGVLKMTCVNFFKINLGRVFN